MREFFFYFCWHWKNRHWKPTRQKDKAYLKDWEAYNRR